MLIFDKINEVTRPGGEKMANIKSAKKRILVNQTKHEANREKKSSMKTAIKKALNNPSEETVKEAYKKIDKALAKNINFFLNKKIIIQK